LKLRRFEKGLEKSTRKDGKYYFYRQQDILIGIELFFYPDPYREEILNAFKEFYPGAFQSCLSLYNKIKRVGFRTPESCYSSAKIIKDHIMKYGKRKAVREINRIWEALEIKLKS
jgi:hypothetical protein